MTNRERKSDLEWPDIAPFEFMADLLYAAGPAEHGFSGLCGLSWSNIQAWLQLSRIDLPPWLINTLSRMSLNYATHRNLASEEASEPPWVSEDRLPEKQEQDVNTLRDTFRAWAKQKSDD